MDASLQKLVIQDFEADFLRKVSFQADFNF